MRNKLDFFWVNLALSTLKSLWLGTMMNKKRQENKRKKGKDSWTAKKNKDWNKFKLKGKSKFADSKKKEKESMKDNKMRE